VAALAPEASSAIAAPALKSFKPVLRIPAE
jgi:hypothetical protein